MPARTPEVSGKVVAITGAGRGIRVAEAHFGYLAAFVALDNPSSSARTR